MNVIRGYEDVTAIMEDSLVVIWGAGVRGRTLLQEIRVNNIENVYIYDENSSKTEGIKERIFLEDIENEINKISFVIAVADDRLANEISDKINRYNNLIGIYRYIPKDVEYLENVLNKEGFYNGKKKCKALDGFQMKELLKKRINNKEPFLFSRWGGGWKEELYMKI